jgi:hypothetical protein
MMINQNKWSPKVTFSRFSLLFPIALFHYLFFGIQSLYGKAAGFGIKEAISNVATIPLSLYY